MKYFVVSDIHSCFTALKNGLNEAGYDKNNPDHSLIIVGDLFDRGDETLELYDFLKSIPEERLILIKGNHEDLYLELLEKEIPDYYDFHNGTVKSFFAIANMDIPKAWKNMGIPNDEVLYSNKEVWWEVVKRVRSHSITSFINDKKWLNYFELDKYVFTHSWFPYSFNKDWREIDNPSSWQEAHFDYVINHTNEISDYIGDKTLVCGHLHSRYYHQLLNPKDDQNDEIFHYENLYVIDTYVIESDKVGVLVIEEK